MVLLAACLTTAVAAFCAGDMLSACTALVSCAAGSLCFGRTIPSLCPLASPDLAAARIRRRFRQAQAMHVMRVLTFAAGFLAGISLALRKDGHEMPAGLALGLVTSGSASAFRVLVHGRKAAERSRRRP
ncbi:hypothetical protein BIV57_10910 [Mangrovactinospora gilvigrisea]|uniref:Uncharacterized protein n=1 Tax=Mangrovactinospora gilvigrisea TaxID=1428644 RepID=A0A1J7BFP3_9ACTN|nr:hypothetical protein BIV57_10910 [Mangrovactinospora gilvigrisea]